MKNIPLNQYPVPDTKYRLNWGIPYFNHLTIHVSLNKLPIGPYALRPLPVTLNLWPVTCNSQLVTRHWYWLTPYTHADDNMSQEQTWP